MALKEIVEAYLDHDKWFRTEVQKGLAQLDNGESLSHDEVVASIERMFQPYGNRWSSGQRI